MFTDKENQCVICWKRINKNTERYVEIRDYNGKSFEDHCFHHLDCWNRKFQITQEKIQEQANEWIDKIKNLDMSKLNFGGSNEPVHKTIKFVKK